MKKILSILVGLTLCCSLIFSIAGCADKSQTEIPVETDKNNWVVSSPDGSLKTEVSYSLSDGLSYSVKKDNISVVEESSLGFDIAEDDFRLLTLQNVGHRRVKGTYKNITGKRLQTDYDCNETVITLKGWKFYLDVTVRTYDDGYAFRYGIRSLNGDSGTFTVLSENSEFALPENSPLWAMPYQTNSPGKTCFSYEDAYNRRTSAAVSDQIISMPMLYQIRGNDLYSLITESGLIGSGYYGSFIAEQKENAGKGILQTVHTPAGCSEEDNKISYPFISPWRIGITGSLATVQESDLVEKVYDDAEYWKPDNYDELTPEQQAIYDYDWVEPGVTAWNWLLDTENRGQNDFTFQREYLDLAVKMGWKYTLLDGGWNTALNDDVITEFVNEAHANNVKVLVWCDALLDFGNGKVEVLKVKLDKFAQYGIDGIKIDFFDGQTTYNNSHQGEDIETIKWYETIYQECAKRKMVVNCHGSNKPTGERRIYPNVINREGIRGNEFKSIGNSTIVNQLFIRNVVGPCDFTPVVSPLSSNVTMASNMAIAVLFESGIPSMADKSYTYLYNGQIKDFYKSIPSNREETIFLNGELDRYYVAAVKSGDEWFIAGLSCVAAMDISIDLSFLGEGEYEAEIFTNDPTDNNSVIKSKKTVTADSKENVSLVRNGGFVYRLKLKK